MNMNDFNEGTNMEPTTEYRFSYVEAVQLAFAQAEEYVETNSGASHRHSIAKPSLSHPRSTFLSSPV
jgi:hypothetical protein